MVEKDALTRIADALERLSPPMLTNVPGDATAYVWQSGVMRPVPTFNPVSVDLLAGVDAQKAAVLENSRRLAAGAAAHDILLWGARGTGKSALVKSTTKAVQDEGGTLRLVEASCDEIDSLPALFGLLSRSGRADARVH